MKKSLPQTQCSLLMAKLAIVTLAIIVLVAFETKAQTGAVGAEFKVNTVTAYNQFDASVATDSDGDFVVTWRSYAQDGSDNGIIAQRYNAAGVAQGSEFIVNTYTPTDQSQPSVAMDSDGDFVITWAGTNATIDPSGFSIYAQLFDANGVPQGSEFIVNTTLTDMQYHPSVAMNSVGDFVVVWQSENQDAAGGGGIYGQRFSNNGIPQGGEFRVNNYTTGAQRSPSVAMDDMGNFIIVWSSYNQDGDNDGIYAQWYGGNGVAQSANEFRVNTFTTDQQTAPSVDMDSDGDFVITWHSQSQDGAGAGIFAQRYNSSVIAQGSEFQVNTYTASSQSTPDVSLDSDGDFVIVWQSLFQDSGIFGIYGQRFKSNGTTIGTEFQVNTFVTDEQAEAEIGMDANGNFVVVWESRTQDGDGIGVYAQRYDGNISPVIVAQTFSMPENSVNGTVIGTVVATDPDAGTLIYAITSGNTGNVFAINSATGELTVAGALDYESTTTYTLKISVTDNGTPPKTSEAFITVDILDLLETGIYEGSEMAGIYLYPNPSRGAVFINLEGEILVKVVDLSGQLLKQVTIENKYLNTEDLREGVYFVEVSHNNQRTIKKLVVE